MRAASRISVIVTLTLLSAAAFAGAGAVNVIQKGRAFNLGNVQIARGGIVRFVNDDLFLHQIYVETPSFNFESDEQEPGANIEVQFSSTGLFEVRCHIHPKMLLRVEVR